VWNRDQGKHIHVRVDGCLVTSTNVQKCDCLIIYFPSSCSKTVLFFVEVKGREYSLDHVKEQIEKTISLTESICGNLRNRVIIPVCYAERHPKKHERFMESYKVRSSKGALKIKLLNTGENIEKALT
jgi:hypothetical protein